MHRRRPLQQFVYVTRARRDLHVAPKGRALQEGQRAAVAMRRALTIKSGHWTGLIRQYNTKRKAYDLFFLDTLNSRVYNNEVKRLLSTTPLFDNIKRRDKWLQVNCTRQTERECGPRTALNLALALINTHDMGDDKSYEADGPYFRDNNGRN